MSVPGPGTYAAAPQLVPLDDDGGAMALLPCACLSSARLTPDQVRAVRGIVTICAGCDGSWTLVPVTAEVLTLIASRTELPAGYVLVLTLAEPA